MVLVDTSVWVNHLHSKNHHMTELLHSGVVLMHPMVLGELAGGILQPRPEILEFLSQLPQSTAADDSEAMQFIERYDLMGKGIGYIDVHLLASAAISKGVSLWSSDRHLVSAAERLDLAYKIA